MSALAEGRSVVLVEGRGCWRLHIIRPGDVIGVDGFWLREIVWARLKFSRTDERDPTGRPILRATEPAIGPPKTKFHATHLPEGWNSPGSLKEHMTEANEHSTDDTKNDPLPTPQGDGDQDDTAAKDPEPTTDGD